MALFNEAFVCHGKEHIYPEKKSWGEVVRVIVKVYFKLKTSADIT